MKVASQNICSCPNAQNLWLWSHFDGKGNSVYVIKNWDKIILDDLGSKVPSRGVTDTEERRRPQDKKGAETTVMWLQIQENTCSYQESEKQGTDSPLESSVEGNLLRTPCFQTSGLENTRVQVSLVLSHSVVFICYGSLKILIQ